MHYVSSDGHGAKNRSIDVVIQSHWFKAVAPFLICLSNEMLQLPHIKVNKPVVNLNHKKLLVGTQLLQIIKERFLSKYFVQ
jgi:hypothetical protein